MARNHAFLLPKIWVTFSEFTSLIVYVFKGISVKYFFAFRY